MIEKNIEIYPDECKMDFEFTRYTTGNGDENELCYIKGEDVTELSGIREYIPGDSMQKVHWKLSSRYEDFMVKEFSMPYTDRVYVSLNLYNNCDMADEMDSVISLYYTLTRTLVMQGRQIFMVWYNDKTKTNEFREIFTENDVLQAVGDLMYSETAKNPEISLQSVKNEFFDENNILIYVAGNSTNVSGEKIYTYSDKAAIYLI